MLQIKKVLEVSGIKVTASDNPTGVVLSFESASAENVDFARELALNVFGYAIRPQNAEVASSCDFLELVSPSSPDYHDVLIASAELADANDDTEEEVEEEEEEEVAPKGKGAPADDEEEIEDEDPKAELEDRSLRVLTGAEHHKMVAKIYMGLCNNKDMAKYPAFTIDFDQFLRRF